MTSEDSEKITLDADEVIQHFFDHAEKISYSDRARLKKLTQQIKARRKAKQPSDKLLSKLHSQMQRAMDLVDARRQKLPEVKFPNNLPISEKREDIAALIEKHQVVILAGETGSGKTTQIPKICLQLGRGVLGRIGHTQPRRIAARTVANRIAEELGVELGTSVGYQVRFNDHSDAHTHIKLMTDGILLMEIQRDPLLMAYDTLIIDEAHERSLNIDFILGYLKNLLPKRPELKLIVTSATIDLDRFSKHFNDAPVIEVSGRTFPVELHYTPWQDEYEDLSEAIVATVDKILRLGRGAAGDILVFLSGEREIREVSHELRKAKLPGLDVMPLYARLSLAEQNKVFQPHKGRRVVLATNVAETSITVPGITHVIDPGTARISRYSVRTKVQRLPIENISKASANQRMGRCGRVANGVCYRLYSQDDFDSRPDFTDAEILRTNLAAVILQMLHLRMGDVKHFPFVDRPENKLINDGFKLLQELQAIDGRGHLTQTGKLLHRLPVDPRYAKALLDSGKTRSVKEVLIIVSALSIQDPRERPADKQQAADEMHRRFWDENSDFLALVNLWNYLETQRQALSQNQLRKLCKKEFLNYLRVREWRDLHHQLRLALKESEIKENQDPANYEAVHRALVAGLISNVGRKNEEKGERNYFGTRNRNFIIFPASSQRKKRPKWIAAAEFIETSQLFAHMVARIDVEWVLNSAKHLLKYSYFEPHYDSKTGQVMAYAKVSLFGLVLVEKKRLSYSNIDAKVAREVFIRAALVEGAYKGKGKFFLHNKNLIQEVHDLEAKSRRKDILVDDEVIYEFYSELVPKNIVNLAGFEHWRKQEERENAQRLYLSKDDIMRHQAHEITEAQFPKQLSINGLSLPVSYHFDPKAEDDGVSIHVPVEMLHLIQAPELEWLVPGMLREKCIAMMKALPKSLRKNFVPVPTFADRALASIKPYSGALVESLSHALFRLTNINIDKDDWRQEELDHYYRMNIVVENESGETLGSGRDLDVLKKKYRARLQSTLQSVSHTIEREDLKQWDFGDLQNKVEIPKGRIRVTGFPALVDNAGQVDIKVLDNPRDAREKHLRGVVRLALLSLSDIKKYLSKQLLRGKDIGLTMVSLGRREQVVDDILMASVKRACFAEAIAAGESLRESRSFEDKVEAGRSQVTPEAQEIESQLVQSLSAVVEIRRQMKASKNAIAMVFTFQDIQQQLERLFYPGFLYDTPAQFLSQYPRYLKAIVLRIEKAPMSVQKDKMAIASLEELWQVHSKNLDKEGPQAYSSNPEWQKYRWMLEEFRVSLFAQSLKTQMPVSEKRLKKQWQLAVEWQDKTLL